MNFTFTEQELQVIVNAIAREPWHVANPILNSIETQIKAQREEKEND